MNKNALCTLHKQPLISKKSAPLSGTLRVPGDKSISHRAIILGSISSGKTQIFGLLESDDILWTCRALAEMGAILYKEGDSWIIQGVGNGCLFEPKKPLYFGNSGTGGRLMMGLAGSYAMQTTFLGDTSLCRRPMKDVLSPLEKMGTQVLSLTQSAYMPLTLKGAERMSPITYTMHEPSAQVKSAILLAALNTPGITTVKETIPTRDHTENMLKLFKACLEIETLKDGGRCIHIQGETNLYGQKIHIPGDPSSAAFLAVSALIVEGSDIIIENVLVNPLRAGIFVTLREMGADIQEKNHSKTLYGEDVADLHIRSSKLKGTVIPKERCPSMIDEYPILAIAASFAEGKTIMHGLKSLRLKESDRIESITQGLRANGVECEELDDGLSITGQAAGTNIGGGTINTQYDHRIAMSFLAMGLATQKPIIVDDGSMISTSFPNFILSIKTIGGIIKPIKQENNEE